MEQQNMQKNTTQDGLNQLEAIEHIIFGLSKENISQSVDLINNKIDEIYQTSFNLIISQMVYIVFRIKMNDIDVYLNFIDEIDKFEKNNNYNSKIMDVFTHYLLNEDTQESNYILYSMIENNMLEPETVITRNYACFAHYMTKERINSMKYEKFINQVKENYEELSKNDWELHKKLIKEGVNPNEIAKIIRYDEIEKLQEISSQTNFDFNQTIEPSLYERCSFINKENVPLIDYAAFFSAIKCFKYLLINGTKLTNTGKYAVAGGNLEIIHLCEQNHATFKDAYETAIEFHKNNIFHYLDENKFIMFFDFVVLGKQCILYHNYEIFSFLEKEGMKIDDDIMNETVSRGNLFLTKYLLKEKHPKKYLLFNSLISGNTELVKFILDKGVNINSTDVFINFSVYFDNFL